jgi:hypothetical protein
MGTPTGTGTYNGVGITVTDATGATAPVSAYYTMTVSYPPLKIVSPTSLSNGQATVAYTSVAFTATGGTAMSQPAGDRGADYEWTASSLPSGMSMSIAGTLSGIPSSPGNYTIAVTLTDALNTSNHITQDFSLTVADAPLQFTTTTLTAIQGQSYTGTVAAQGGQSPYTMYRVAGSLPNGVTFNDGTISVGSTVSSGEYQFSIGLIDSQDSPATAEETFTLWVAPGETSPNLTVGSSINSAIWGGYIEQASSAFTSVSGTLTVPTIRATPENEVSPWVGIDGYGDGTVLQAGVEASANDSHVTYEAWWETYPANSPQNLFAVSPGDTVNVNIWQLSAGQWEMTLNDVTDGEGFDVQVSYTGNGDTTAEWIMEEDSTQAATGYGATSVFSKMLASQTGNGMLECIAPNETPGSLTSGGFTLTQY